MFNIFINVNNIKEWDLRFNIFIEVVVFFFKVWVMVRVLKFGKKLGKIYKYNICILFIDMYSCVMFLWNILNF